MSRSRSFALSREPFRENDSLQPHYPRITGPGKYITWKKRSGTDKPIVSWLNPTKAQFHHSHLLNKASLEKANVTSTAASDEEKAYPSKNETTTSHVSFLWRSRDNRKGRHTMAIGKPQSGEEDRYIVPARTTEARQIAKGILRMFTVFPYWDISWWVAVVFTLGSVVWVLNAFFVWLPAVDPSTEFSTEILYGGGITAFIGAIVFFETGSILLIFEAFNENSSGCFGWALEQLASGEHADGKTGQIRITPDKHLCHHHHQNRKNFVGRSSADTHPEAKPANEATKDGKTWQWFPSWHALRTHYFHELGFLAGCAQLFGATIFGISGFTALPGIQPITPQSVLNGVYWIPQIVGGCGFIVSGTLYMLETQKNWYTPALGVLGWHIGFWNWIGGWGFTLSGALGPAYGNSGAQYQAGCATFWGSWAFLIGSLLQWYESLDKYPVVYDRGKDSVFRPG
jgi:hypothetical protein